MLSLIQEQPAVPNSDHLNMNIDSNGAGKTKMQAPALILASGSPRRQELLERFWGKVHPQVLIPEFDERDIIEKYDQNTGPDFCGLNSRPGDSHELSQILSSGKLLALEQQFVLPDSYAAIAADTLVVLDEHILGKPADSEDAVRMLKLLSGQPHVVMTSICLAVRHGSERKMFQATEQTIVRFAPLTAEQIDWYIGTGEPLDKAGAYGIQGFGAALVEGIEGCYYNVMGLPVHRLMALLQTAAKHFSSFPELSELLPWH